MGGLNSWDFIALGFVVRESFSFWFSLLAVFVIRVASLVTLLRAPRPCPSVHKESWFSPDDQDAAGFSGEMSQRCP